MSELKIYSERIKYCIEQKKHVFVGYITAGYPDIERFFETVKRCCAEGLPVLEVGFPSENPYEDGDVIRNAHKQVGTALCHDLEFWRRLRAEVDIPIWLMGYHDDLIQGDIFYELAKEKLYDGLVIPDTDIKERIRLRDEMAPLGIDVVGFISSDDSFQEITMNYRNFKLIYQRLYSGPTGLKSNGTEYEDLLRYSKSFQENIIFGGFGISSGNRVKELLEKGFYGAIIGTEMMRKLNHEPEELYHFVEELSDILKGEDM